jgi:predicted enzyme related to lactoylglutathione lyase
MPAPDRAPGTPIWVDLGSSDLDASKAFYTALLGWDAFTIPDPAAGGYTMFLKDGKQVAALGGLQNPEGPSAWSTYIGTSDADATAARVREAGGQVIAPPFEVLGAGRMGVFQDPTGAFVSIWEPNEVAGIELAYEPGSLCWSELNTRDLNGARQFYGAVFDWDADDTVSSNGQAYLVWKLGDRQIAGAIDINQLVPDTIPAHWLPYFGVEDADAAVARVPELGGTAITEVMEVPEGRFAVVSDPQGAVFAVMGVSGQA